MKTAYNILFTVGQIVVTGYIIWSNLITKQLTKKIIDEKEV